MKLKLTVLLALIIAFILMALNTKSNYDEIPKIIHQSAMADKTKWHKIWKRCQKSWKEKFPDFEYKMWHDEDLDEFMKTKHKDFYDNVYSKYDINIKRFDSARYFILREFGGIYADMDFECLENFWEHIPKDKVSIAECPRTKDTHENALMISPKGHPFWDQIIDKLPKRMNGDVIYATGPGIITDTLREGASINSLKKEDFSVDNARFTRHLWTGSWNGWNGNFENFRVEPRYQT